MLIQINAAKCIGIDAVKITVEVEIRPGIGIFLCGLADAAVKESLLRTTTALESLGYKIPGKKITINLAPADLHKVGSGYDLPIALGIIAASGKKEFPSAGRFLVMGELGLDGEVRSIPGALPCAEMAQKEGYRGIIMPMNSALEATEFKDLEIYGVRTLEDAIRVLSQDQDCSDLLVWNLPEFIRMKDGADADDGSDIPDFSDIIGQEGAKRALEIAAAGGHNAILIGSPGSGKSSLAKALAGILPPMTRQEALVTSKIYSICGKNTRHNLISRRPFRSPHYSASMAAIVGGGGGDAIMPGEVSLAQNGVLFLDEFGQIPRSVIEALRGPMEDRKVTISRLRTKVEYPASFMLVAASNPCPCGYWGEGDRCTCSPAQKLNYLGKLSGPIMDRIDLHIWMKAVSPSSIFTGRKSEGSAEVRERVTRAREIQKKRFKGLNVNTNAEMNNKHIEQFCPLDEKCRITMLDIMSGMGFSMRAYFRIIKVARTIADLENAADIKPSHLMEAASFRFLDKDYSA